MKMKRIKAFISQLGMVHVDLHENPRLKCIETVYTCKGGVMQKA